MLINLKIQEAMEKSSQKRQQAPKDPTPETSQTTSDPVIAKVNPDLYRPRFHQRHHGEWG